MGLVKLDKNGQFTDYIHCDLFDNKTLIKKASVDNITDSSVIYVDSNQFLILVSSEIVIDFTMEDGFYSYSSSSEPIMLNNEYGKKLYEYNQNKNILTNTGVIAYYISTNKIGGNKFGTTNPISYFDSKLGINLDLRFYGVYTVRVTNPVLFYYSYKNIIKDKLIYDNKINDEFLNDFILNLPKSFDELSSQDIDYELLSDYNKQIAKKLNTLLREKWSVKGINVVDLSIASITLTEESLDKIMAKENKSQIKLEDQWDKIDNNVLSQSIQDIENIEPRVDIKQNSYLDTLNQSIPYRGNIDKSKDEYLNNYLNNTNYEEPRKEEPNKVEENANPSNSLNVFDVPYVNTKIVDNNQVTNNYTTNTVKTNTNVISNNFSVNDVVKNNIDKATSLNDSKTFTNDVTNLSSVGSIDSISKNSAADDLESLDDFVCPNCHAIMDDDYDYCQCCGTKRKGITKEEDITCPICFYKNVPNSKFCNNCGSKL